MKYILIIVLTIMAGIELGQAGIDSVQRSSARPAEQPAEKPSSLADEERSRLNYYAGFSRRAALSE